jgi:hypothetical protein
METWTVSKLRDPTKPHKVGDKIQVFLSGGKIVDTTIKAVLDGYTDGPRFQVDFGNNHTALIRGYQIVKE